MTVDRGPGRDRGESRPYDRIARMRICVFCGSADGRRPLYTEAARELGTLLAGAGIGLVYGGATVGTMGTIARAALDAGGEVIGVIPQQLVEREIAHKHLSEQHVVADMHERKATMARLADGFIALPGAAGTLEELAEIWTWAQLGLHDKPVGLLDVGGYYRHLRAQVDHMVTEGFLRPRHRAMLLVEADAATLLKRFGEYEPPAAKFSSGVAAELLDVEPAPAIDAVGWVCVRDRRVLMVRSRDNELLFLPGGRREPGESDVTALCREVQEELSVRLRPETFCYFDSVREPADGFDDGRQVSMVCYLAAHSGTPRASGEITELAWLRRGDTDLVPPAGRRVLAELAARDLID